MNETDFSIGQVIHDIRKDRDYRILWISHSENIPSYWICLSSNTNVPSAVSLEDLTEGMDSGVYSYAPDNWRPVQHGTPGSTALARKEKAWSLIRDAVTDEPGIYDPARRSVILHEIENSTGTKIPNLYVYLGKYWKAGKVPDALLPDYSMCGKTKDLLQESAGRPGKKKVPGAQGKKLTAKDLQNFRSAIDRYYLSDKKLSLNKTFQKLIEDFYTIKDSDGKIVGRMDPDEQPSRYQFLYWHRKNRDTLDEILKRDGGRKYCLESRGGTGRTETHLYGPGAACQIDATIGDIYLVSEDDRSAIIGRPTMYFQMDSFSHMVTGMNITLDPPSMQSASLTILNSIEDKVSYCAKFGITITEEDWPCMHLPSIILGDRGEMESRMADTLVSQLGITIENAPPYRGDLKGIIESHFHTINFSMQELPGKMLKDAGNRCAPDYRLKAALTLNEFTAIIIKCVLQYNNYHYMKDYRRTPQMRQLHVKPIPRDLWNFGIRYLSGGLRTMDREYVRYCLLPKGEASITRQGIRFNGRSYTCEKAEQEKWYDSARSNHTWKVTASYDPHNAAVIFISPSAGQPPVECHLLEKDSVFSGRTTAEADAMHEEDKNEYMKWLPEEDFQAAKVDEYSNGIIRNAVYQMPTQVKKSKSARISEIKKNREHEKELINERNTAAAITSGCTSQAAPEPVCDDSLDDDPMTEMLRRALDEKLKKGERP